VQLGGGKVNRHQSENGRHSRKVTSITAIKVIASKSQHALIILVAHEIWDMMRE
jgi:hypothetical protein